MKTEPGLVDSAKRIVAMVDCLHPRKDAKCKRNTVYRILRAYIAEAEDVDDERGTGAQRSGATS